jgi:hypothetical protein
LDVSGEAVKQPDKKSVIPINEIIDIIFFIK